MDDGPPFLMLMMPFSKKQVGIAIQIADRLITRTLIIKPSWGDHWAERSSSDVLHILQHGDAGSMGQWDRVMVDSL